MKKSFLILCAGWILISFRLYSQDFWEPIPYPNTTEPMSCFAMNSDGRLFACQQDNIFYTDDMGDNWFTTTNWPGYYPKSIVINSSDHIFIATFNDGIMRSTDGGVTFQEINNGLTPDMIRCLVLMNNDVLLAGTSLGLFRSVNNGDLWESFGTGLPIDWLEELSVGENGKLFAGMLNSGVHRSYDYGVTWSEASNGLPGTTQVTSILTVPGSTTAYVGLFPQGLYCSLDDGDNWVEHNEGLPFKNELTNRDRDFSLHGLTIVHQLIFMYIYANLVYFNEVYGSPLIPWFPLFGGIPEGTDVNAMNALILTHVICGTTDNLEDGGTGLRGPGIFINAVPVDIPVYTKPAENYKLSVSPNPFSGITKIRISNPDECLISLTLQNQLGQEIVRLKDEIFPEGIHEINLALPELEPGLFILKMNAGGVVLTKKVVHLR